MIKINTHLGAIELTNSYLSSLIGHTAASCFGVVKMNPAGASQGVKSTILKSDSIDNGVKVTTPKGTDRLKKDTDRLVIDLHITVMYGVNVAAITDSIMNKVRYTVERETGLKVDKVNVFVDGMENS